MIKAGQITVVGGGPAGASAAIAAATTGARVTVFEQSRMTRHRVCGEFLSTEIVPFLERLGVWDQCVEAGAVPVRRMVLRFARTEKTAHLREPAFALSRFALDRILLDRAAACGATVVRERADLANASIVAVGRRATGTPGRQRLFGFKAHFSGPMEDAVELYFGSGVYVGVNAVEGGHTNVCGLAGEGTLRRFGFDIDAVCASIPALNARMRPLTRCWKWLTTGPVEFRRPRRDTGDERVYRAGDALSFVDPFTGTGITNAVVTGASAGWAAARGRAVAEYLQDCGKALSGANRWAATFRAAVQYGVAEHLAPFVPAATLVGLTRPRAADLLV